MSDCNYPDCMMGGGVCEREQSGKCDERTPPPDSRTAEERAAEEYAADRCAEMDPLTREECAADYLAGFRARDELLDQFRVQIAQSILVMEAAIKERDTLKAELADLRKRGEVQVNILETMLAQSMGMLRAFRDYGSTGEFSAAQITRLLGEWNEYKAALADSQKGDGCSR